MKTIITDADGLLVFTTSLPWGIDEQEFNLYQLLALTWERYYTKHINEGGNPADRVKMEFKESDTELVLEVMLHFEDGGPEWLTVKECLPSKEFVLAQKIADSLISKITSTRVSREWLQNDILRTLEENK